jgi:phospholipid/cholesterol/gamma-HCH transport system permease protein
MSGPARSVLWRFPEWLGGAVRAMLTGLADFVVYVGGVAGLLWQVADRSWRAVTGRGMRVRLTHLADQSFRFGVRSVPIVMLVESFIGLILALNLAPTLASYGQVERVADVVAIGILRELGPLITAVLLSGFAGASIAAELGAMTEGEEIKALRAHALDPIRFLVVPRVIATAVMMLGLVVVANVCGVLGGLFTGVVILGISPSMYLDLTQDAVGPMDYFTGLSKAFVFGGIIAGIACYEGLNVRGGAEGVGRATTTTVVKSIVALIGTDCLFTGVFYALGW